MSGLSSSHDALGPEKLWGLRAISRALSLSVDKTRRLASEPEVPITGPPGATSR